MTKAEGRLLGSERNVGLCNFEGGRFLEPAYCSQPMSSVGRQHCQVPGPFDGHCQCSLVFGADARLASRFNFELVRNISGEHPNVFVIYVFNMIDTE